MIVVNQGPPLTWWRHQMETFSALLALCAKNSPVTGEFPSQRPVTRSFGVFFDLCLSKRLSKQSRRRWFQTPSSSLWCHCNVSISNYCESIALVFKHPRVSLQNARNNFGKSLSIFYFISSISISNYPVSIIFSGNPNHVWYFAKAVSSILVTPDGMYNVTNEFIKERDVQWGDARSLV